MSGRMKKQDVCLQMLIKTKNAKLREAILEHADAELIRALCECAHNILRGNVKMTPRGEDATAEVSDQITTDSTQEREREAETSTSTTDRWILTGVASSIGGLCRHTVATSTVCVTKGTGDDEGDQGTRGLTKGTGWISLLIGTRGDQRDRRWLR